MLIQEIGTLDSISAPSLKGLEFCLLLPNTLDLCTLNLPGCSEPLNLGNHIENNLVIQWYGDGRNKHTSIDPWLKLPFEFAENQIVRFCFNDSFTNLFYGNLLYNRIQLLSFLPKDS